MRDQNTNLISMSELARRSEVNVETIRFYLKKKLILTPKNTLGIHKFSLDYIEQVKFIKSAQKVGFSLGEVKDILDLKLTKRQDCTSIKKLTEKKVLEIEAKIKDLKKIIKVLKSFEGQCNGYEGTENCSILNNLKRIK